MTPRRSTPPRPVRVAVVDTAAVLLALLCLASSVASWIAVAARNVPLWRFTLPFTYVTGATALVLLAAGLWLATRRR